MRPLALVLLLACGCTSDRPSQDTQAAHGAAAGAAYGSFSAVVLSLVFGDGNVGGAAAVGAATGAAVGGASGAYQDEKEREREERIQQQWELHQREKAEMEEVKRNVAAKLGQANAEALILVFDCRYEDARPWIEQAYRSPRPEAALGALWLQCLMAEDQGKDEEARYYYPKLVAADPEVEDEAAAHEKAREVVGKLREARRQLGRPPTCWY